MQRELPVHGGSLAGYLCPEPGEGTRLAARDRRIGKRQLRALQRAFRSNPGAVVSRTVFPEGGGTQRKDITIEDLVELHRVGFEHLRGGDYPPAPTSAYGRCLRDGEHALTLLQQQPH